MSLKKAQPRLGHINANFQDVYTLGDLIYQEKATHIYTCTNKDKSPFAVKIRMTEDMNQV
jgi:hypothetical protein